MAKKETYVDTDFPGIKQRISDGKYIVTLDFGRQMRLDKKTGEMKLKQVKTTRVCTTLKEAKALQGKNNEAKIKDPVTNTTKKIPFSKVLDEYTEYYQKNWSNSYDMQKKSQAKRMKAYFGDTNVKEIDTLDIEKFFKWNQEEHPLFPQPLGNNSIQKMRVHLSDIWKYMKKNPSKYGRIENVVLDAEVGEIEKYEATIISAEQVNYLLQYVINNKRDYAYIAMVAFPSLTGMRRGELCGLRWKNILYDKGLIDIEYQRVQIGTGSIQKVPKGGKDNGKTRNEKKQRYCCLPNCLVTILGHIKKQQEEYLHRKVNGNDYVFMTKTNLVNGYLPHPGKVSRWFKTLETQCNIVREKAGLEPIPDIRLHDLRHTFISLCLNGGINQFQVSANCGHNFKEKGQTTTVATYWHDDNNRSDINEFIDKIITVNLNPPDMTDAIKN